MMLFLKTCRTIKSSKCLKDIQKPLSILNSNVSTNSSILENEDIESVVKDKILFNSVINAKQPKLGYFEARKVFSKRKQEIQSVQPLPISLKFLSENINSVDKKHNPKPKIISEDVQFPYNSTSNTIVGEVYTKNETNDLKRDSSEIIDLEIRSRNENLRKWMTAYENLEYDIVEDDENDINYGTPDPKSKISKVPCGGCGAFLHCKDTSIPGYIPSEIFKNANKLGAEDLEAIICQRCFFLKEHDIALQVRVSADDYPKVLKTIYNKKALVLLIVDLTDFPCSIWPGIADILGPRTPVFVVGNKVDLLPKDGRKFLSNIKQKLYEYIKICGFGTSNILDVSLISAKTGYGVEDLISSLQTLWQVKDVYLVGCTNVGKSSLFNALLQSDYCKFQASDLILRATTSQWPGTTLNLLKFPIMRTSHHKLFMRNNRLTEMNKRLVIEEERRKELLKSQNTVENATLIGRIERTFSKDFDKPESDDSFTTQVNLNDTGIKMGLKENHPDFVSGRWCFDTPGVVHPDQILDLLTLDELILTLPKELIRPESFCVKPGTSLFIAGLARLDYISGPDSVKLTVFRSNQLPITVCNLEVAENIYNDCLGSDMFKVPMSGVERLNKWPGLQKGKEFVIAGSGKRSSSKDIVLSNAGWIAVTCSQNEFTFQAWTPEKRGIHVRDCILPNTIKLKGNRIKYSVAYEQHRFI